MAKKDNYIYYNGEKLLLSEWVIPADKAGDYPKNNESYVRKLIWNKRNDKANRKQIDFVEIPELRITLVRK